MIGEKNWGVSHGSYQYEAITGLKSYVIGKEVQSDKFGNKELQIISAETGTSGKDRFYVMALEDLDEELTWYSNAWDSEGENESIEDKPNFGKNEPNGMMNTKEMIEEWNKRC